MNILTYNIKMILISWNQGQVCCAGSRIFVQAGIYDEFLKRFTAKAQSIKVGDPFSKGIDQGPQVSKIQYDVCISFSVRSLCLDYLFN